MENKRGFYFKTLNNKYFYDDITGNVSYTDSIDDTEINTSHEEYTEIYVTEEEVKELVQNSGTNQLILVVTENCNLRCKYCVYSGEYDNSRVHKNNMMDLYTAKKAIYKYVESVNLYRKKNILFRPTIGFFGGEPLLNYNLITESVKYANKIYEGKIYYTITTNAMLLDDEKIDFFVKNNIFLVISLNGYKEENDRLRVSSNNIGTYDTIIKNLELIYIKYPNYYKNNVSISAVFDDGTDMFKLKKFFDNNILVRNKLAVLSKVIDTHTNWYDQYSNEQKQLYKEQIIELKQMFFNQIKNKEPINEFLKKLFLTPYITIMNRNLNQSIKECKAPVQPFSGSCLPGIKVSVDYKGELHMCEKINSAIPIGTVDTWIDYKKVTTLLNRYNNYLGKYCNNCTIQRLCPICYRDIVDNDGTFNLNNSEWCKNYINNIKQGFSEIYSLLESGTKLSDFENV